MRDIKKNYLILLICCFCGQIYSQENKNAILSFSNYAKNTLEIYNITCNMPDNFIDLNRIELLNLGKQANKHRGLCCPIMESNDNQCVIMYHLVPEYGCLTNNLIIGEICKMFKLNCCDNSITDTINIGHYATIITGYYARTSFNADSVILMDIPLQCPYKDKYLYCISMFITKQAHATMILKWLFTETGKKNKDNYLNSFSKKIWYNEGEWKYDYKKSVKLLPEFLDLLNK
jgi:hypothetical protein